MSRGTKLTTTSYAILGLLAIKPWSSYELAQQMQRSLRRFWPRAESKLYEEPKKLVALGMATGATEWVGKRQRTVYTITAEGRRALTRWLAEPGDGPLLEFEQLLKVFFAEHGSKRDLLATLDAVRTWAEERATQDAEIARSYLAGEGRFQQRAAQLVLVGRFSADFAEMTGRWARWATELVEVWPEDFDQVTPDEDSLKEIAASRAGEAPG